MLINIQFLRFMAAMLVVLYHTSALVPDNSSSIHGLFVIGESLGFAGVDIFFVISGFIMVHTTHGQAGGHHGLDFAKRRFARIYSGHWPFFLLTLLIFYWARPGHFEKSNLLASFALWPQPLNRILLDITWTLSFELYFYLLFSLLVWLVPVHKRMMTCFVLALLLVFLALYRELITHSFGPEQLYFMSFAEHFLISPFIIEFFAGALLAFHLKKHAKGTSTPWLFMGCGLFLIAGLVNSQIYGGHIEQGFYVVPRVIFFGTASLMIVLGLVRLENRSISAPVQFSLRTGGASYAIYLSHILILVLASKLGVNAFLNELPFALTTIGYLLLMALILAYSVLHYEKLEKPLHNLFKNWLGLTKPTPRD
jgi:peptidoglycan/LPS O-acetylase OafA/YrhL